MIITINGYNFPTWLSSIRLSHGSTLCSLTGMNWIFTYTSIMRTWPRRLVTGRSLNAKILLRSQSSPSDICRRKRSNGTGFRPGTSFSLPLSLRQCSMLHFT